ncbi:MAG: hypothetical protein J07HX5_01297, partial [halophilic archaeon J07HX5]
DPTSSPVGPTLGPKADGTPLVDSQNRER